VFGKNLQQKKFEGEREEIREKKLLNKSFFFSKIFVGDIFLSFRIKSWILNFLRKNRKKLKFWEAKVNFLHQ